MSASIVQSAVAAGLRPAVEPGILPGGLTSVNAERKVGRQDAALYGRPEARRYFVCGYAALNNI